MYEHILLSGGKFVNILNACPDLYPRTIVLNGVSKAYAMTGWRIGYCGGPSTIILAMENIQSQSTSNPSSISQAAAEAALNGDQSCMAPMVEAFKKRNRFVTGALNAIPGVNCLLSEGAFYAFADMREAIARLNAKGVLSDPSDIALSEYLLEDAGVAVVPGSAFGSEGYIRLSFATAMANLENALSRIAKVLG
jgi:aspartate aminotransferase